mmetsp:Transcript_25030/g.60230  ORF Transcript_25030/g.60230 Transcript_25030/m.60230 type:complete len:114 (-) Transcript_25030:106-447(-)
MGEHVRKKRHCNHRGIKQRKGWRGFNKRASAPVAPSYGGDLFRENGGGACCALCQTSCLKEKIPWWEMVRAKAQRGIRECDRAAPANARTTSTLKGGAPIENNVPWWHKLDHN